MKNETMKTNRGKGERLSVVSGWAVLVLVLLGVWGCGSSDGSSSSPDIGIAPDAFAFTAQTDVDVDMPVYSNEITVTGIEEEAVITITGGDGAYSINGGMFTNEDGTVYEGDTVVVRLTASHYYNTVVTTEVSIGGLSSVFSVGTVAASDMDSIPDGFEFEAGPEWN